MPQSPQQAMLGKHDYTTVSVVTERDHENGTTIRAGVHNSITTTYARVLVSLKRDWWLGGCIV